MRVDILAFSALTLLVGRQERHLACKKQLHLLLSVFHHHSLFHSRLKTFFFCKSFPLQPFFFFFSTDYIIPPTFTVTSSIGCFYFLVFSLLVYLVVVSVR